MLRRSLLILVPLLVSLPLRGDEITLIRDQISGYYTGATAERSHPVMSAALAELERQARSLARPDYLLSDGRWTDIDYSVVPAGEWPAWNHFRRLSLLARAWATPGQGLHGDPALLSAIESAILHIDTFYGSAVPAKGNWWFWTIGPALDLGPALVLVREAIRPEVLQLGTSILKLRIGPYPGISSSWSLLDGQNVVWSSMNHLMLGILTADERRMSQVWDRMASTVRITSGEGIQSDLSFHQHGKQLYTGGYGSSFAFDVSRYQLFTQHTRYALPAASGKLFDDFMVEAIAFSLYGAWFDPSVIGREISKPWTTGHNGYSALLHAAATDGPRRAEVAGAAAAVAQRWPWGLPVELAALATRLDAVPESPAGFRMYPESDYVIFRTGGWYSSIRMVSTRTKSGEATNGEGLLGSRQSDGRLHLSVTGDEYWDGTWAAMDWARLPGITVERHAGAASATYLKGGSAFAGATGSAAGGVAAMDLAPLDSAVRAKKAWVFFPDSIVFLSSRISSTSQHPIETVVDQRPVRSTQPFVVDGRTDAGDGRGMRWAAGEGIGYWFPRGQNVRVDDELRSGSWSSLGTASGETVSRRIRTIRIEHGTAPSTETAEYVIVPAVDANGMQRWVEASPVEIVENGPLVSAARDRRSGATGVAFWTAARTIAGVAADRSSLVWLEPEGRNIAVSVSEPARSAIRVRLTFDGAWRVPDGGATLVATSPHTTTFDVVVSGGRTTTFVLEPAPQRRRAVRR